MDTMRQLSHILSNSGVVVFFLWLLFFVIVTLADMFDALKVFLSVQYKQLKVAHVWLLACCVGQMMKYKSDKSPKAS